jgi:hypothetical protein
LSKPGAWMEDELESSERSLIGRLGAHALHAKYDSRARWFTKFIDEVDPDRVLAEGERLKRAEHRMRAHMTKLALRSAQARRKRKAS